MALLSFAGRVSLDCTRNGFMRCYFLSLSLSPIHEIRNEQKNAEQRTQKKKGVGEEGAKAILFLVLYVTHTFIALGLLSELGEVDVVFASQGGSGHCFFD